MSKINTMLNTGANLIKEIDIITNTINDLSSEPQALFTMNRLIQERNLLNAELMALKLELREII